MDKKIYTSVKLTTDLHGIILFIKEITAIYIMSFFLFLPHLLLMEYINSGAMNISWLNNCPQLIIWIMNECSLRYSLLILLLFIKVRLLPFSIFTTKYLTLYLEAYFFCQALLELLVRRDFLFVSGWKKWFSILFIVWYLLYCIGIHSFTSSESFKAAPQYVFCRLLIWFEFLFLWSMFKEVTLKLCSWLSDIMRTGR